jgi:two-component system, LytTR family, response regulator
MKTSTLIIEDEPLARQTLRNLLKAVDWVEIVGETDNGLDAVDLIDQLEPELIFLDIQIPEISGLEVLNRTKHKPFIIFTTAFDNYAITAFDLEAVDYLLKPFGKVRFQEAVARVHRRLENSLTTQKDLINKFEDNNLLTHFFVRYRNSIIPLKVKEISKFTADGDYTCVFSGDHSYLTNISLNDVEKRLNPSIFCRVHRAAIVNLEFIDKVELYDRRLRLFFKDGTNLIASRKGSQTLRKFIL